MSTLYLDESWLVRERVEAPGLHVEDLHFSDLVPRLPLYMRGFKGLKKHDPEAASLLRKVGAPIGTPESLYSIDIVPEKFMARMPAFRAVFFDWEGDAEKCPLAGAVLIKEANPVNVQPSNGTVYRLVPMWHERKFGTFALSCHVAIMPDGSVRRLKSCQPRAQVIPTKHGRKRSVVRMQWAHEEWSNETDLGEDPDDHIFGIVSAIASAEMPSDCIYVRATAGKNTIAIGIDKRRASRFFADRDLTDGRKKKVLHYVRGHYRETGIDTETFVRPHFRGERHLRYGPIAVKLSVPEWHHADISKFAAPGHDARDLPGGITLGTVGEMMAGAMDREFFLSRRPQNAP